MVGDLRVKEECMRTDVELLQQEIMMMKERIEELEIRGHNSMVERVRGMKARKSEQYERAIELMKRCKCLLCSKDLEELETDYELFKRDS